MSIINIRPAQRAGAKVVIGIAGQSGSGKTLTALYIARGMVDKPEEIGFLDTENRRGSLYSDELDGPFMIGDLFPPFTPQRYAEAIKEFEAAGVKVLVIDSVTHEWEGEGGCVEIAENTSGRIADWKRAKAEHKKYMNVLLQADMDIIASVRAREQMDFRNPKQPVSLGIQPVCEKNFMFEMTASVMMFDEGKRQQHLKVPKDLKPIFGDGTGYIGQDVGRGIRQWINEGVAVDPILKSWMAKLQSSASGGMASLAETWAKVPRHIQPNLKAHKDQCKASAEAYDKIAREGQESAPLSAGAGGDGENMQAFNPAKPDPEPTPQQQETLSEQSATGEASQEPGDIDNF